MPKTMFYPKSNPNYSGVTIQIMNPAVNVGQESCNPCIYGGQIPKFVNYPPAYSSCSDYSYNPHSQNEFKTRTQDADMAISANKHSEGSNEKIAKSLNVTTPLEPQAYPANYYLNNYNYGNQTGTGVSGGVDGGANISGDSKQYNPFAQHQNEKNSLQKFAEGEGAKGFADTQNPYPQQQGYQDINTANESPSQNSHVVANYDPAAYKHYAAVNPQKEEDMTTSQNIIKELNERDETAQEEKKNTKEKKIVALTDEYIKSLENYLNNPNDEIRLMASKEILTRLDEDKDRYDDAALNALLNKMLQDPSKLVRIAALSAFSSQLASGNNYTVKLLTNIQSNPNADKEDVLQAADILLKMSAGVEVKRIPNPKTKETEQKK